jgi:hypothetical protein
MKNNLIFFKIGRPIPLQQVHRVSIITPVKFYFTLQQRQQKKRALK